AESLALIKGAFSGQPGPAYDMIALNSAAILVVADIVDSYEAAIAKARDILDSGQAQAKLAAYAAYTQSLNAG
ncbi:MAG: anthranilate phosphoribosyltransferase, partial [Gammaproteobacteria bacterium]